MYTENLEAVNSIIKCIDNENELDDIIETVFYQKSNINIKKVNQYISNNLSTNIRYLKLLDCKTSDLYIQTKMILKDQQMKEYYKLSNNIYSHASPETKDMRINTAEAIKRIEPNIALTLNFNPKITTDVFDSERALKTMNHFFKELNVLFKFDGYYTFEHCSTNIHAHLALHVDDVPLVNVDEWLIKTEDIIELLWKDCIQSGAVWLSYIDKPKGWAQYIVKHIQETNEIIPTPSFDVL